MFEDNYAESNPCLYQFLPNKIFQRHFLAKNVYLKKKNMLQ